MLWVLVFLLFPHYAIASDDISYAKSETLHCSDNVCHVMNTINLFLNPQQTTELNLMSKGKIFGKLELQIKQLYTNCSKSDVYYMRDYEIKTIPRARCAAAGMCSTQNCAKINPKGHHFELPDKVQKWPGINFCADSCTTFACGFCFHGHGCSFWRNYAIPLNNLVFKIFKCSFDAVGADLSVKISLNGNNSKKFDVLGLIPAVTKKSNTFAFTLANYNLPTNNNERFIMQLGSKNKFLHIDDDEKFAKTVKCATQQKALRFKNYDCNFESDYCSCIPVQNNVNCVYKKSPIKQAFNEHNLLPLEKMGKTYQYKKGHVQTIFNKFSSLQLNIDLMNIDIAVEYSSAGCNFTNCPTITFDVTCGTDETKHSYVNFANKMVNEECELICGDQKSKVLIKGTLETWQKDLNNEVFVPGEEPKSDASGWDNFWNAVKSFFETVGEVLSQIWNYKGWLLFFVIVLAIVAIVVAICIFCPILIPMMANLWLWKSKATANSSNDRVNNVSSSYPNDQVDGGRMSSDVREIPNWHRYR